MQGLSFAARGHDRKGDSFPTDWTHHLFSTISDCVLSMLPAKGAGMFVGFHDRLNAATGLRNGACPPTGDQSQSSVLYSYLKEIHGDSKIFGQRRCKSHALLGPGMDHTQFCGMKKLAGRNVAARFLEPEVLAAAID